MKRKYRLLFLLPLLVLLGGCGDPTPTTGNGISIPTLKSSKPIPTDFGVGNFIRDGIADLLNSLAGFMGDVGIGSVKLFISNTSNFNLTEGGEARQCTVLSTQGSFTIENPFAPLQSCSIFIYDSFKYLPAAILGFVLLYFLVRYTFQGLLGGNRSLTDYVVNVILVSVICLNLDFILTLIVDIASRFFVIILTIGDNGQGGLWGIGTNLFNEVKGVGLAIVGIGFAVLLLISFALFSVGGFYRKLKVKGMETLQYALVGTVGIALLGVGVPILIDFMTAGTVPPAPTNNPPIDPSQELDRSLNALKGLFNIGPIHNKDLGLAILLVVVDILPMLSLLIIALFFLIRLLLFLMYFLMGTLAITAKLVDEFEFLWKAWYMGVVKLAATSLPLALVLRLAIAVAGGIQTSSGVDPLAYIVMMLIISALFGLGAAYAVIIMRAEVKSAGRTLVNIKNANQRFTERVTGNSDRTPSGFRPPESQLAPAANEAGKVTLPGATGQLSALPTSAPPAELTQPLTYPQLTAAVSTGMKSALESTQAQEARQWGAMISQLSAVKVGVDEIRESLRHNSGMSDFSSILEQILQELRLAREAQERRQTQVVDAEVIRRGFPGAQTGMFALPTNYAPPINQAAPPPEHQLGGYAGAGSYQQPTGSNVHYPQAIGAYHPPVQAPPPIEYQNTGATYGQSPNLQHPIVGQTISPQVPMGQAHAQPQPLQGPPNSLGGYTQGGQNLGHTSMSGGGNELSPAETVTGAGTLPFTPAPIASQPSVQMVPVKAWNPNTMQWSDSGGATVTVVSSRPNKGFTPTPSMLINPNTGAKYNARPMDDASGSRVKPVKPRELETIIQV